MYATKQKKSMSLYRDFSPVLSNSKNTEIEVYIGYKVGKEISNDMRSMVRHMSTMTLCGFAAKEE